MSGERRAGASAAELEPPFSGAPADGLARAAHRPAQVGARAPVEQKERNQSEQAAGVGALREERADEPPAFPQQVPAVWKSADAAADARAPVPNPAGDLAW